MTREERNEAIENLNDILTEATWYDDSVCYVTSEDAKWLRLAIEALEQQPCDDCISRRAVNELQKYRYNCGDTTLTCVSLNSINALPPVMPQ